MNDKIKKIRSRLKSNPKQGLKEFAKLIEEFKEATAKEKKEFRKAVKSLEEDALNVYRELYYKKTDAPERVAEDLAATAKNIFDKGGLGVKSITGINNAMKLLQDGDIEAAVKIVKRSARTVHYRAQTIVNTLRLGRSRGSALDKALQSGVTRFKYVGPSFNIRPFCRAHLNKTYTIDEIRDMDNGQGLPVAEFCGGHNCQHRFVPVVE